jgi:hypothetical protein
LSTCWNALFGGAGLLKHSPALIKVARLLRERPIRGFVLCELLEEFPALRFDRRQRPDVRAAAEGGVAGGDAAIPSWVEQVGQPFGVSSGFTLARL